MHVMQQHPRPSIACLLNGALDGAELVGRPCSEWREDALHERAVGGALFEGEGAERGQRRRGAGAREEEERLGWQRQLDAVEQLLLD